MRAKRFLCGLTALFLLCALFGCSDGYEREDDPERPPTTAAAPLLESTGGQVENIIVSGGDKADCFAGIDKTDDGGIVAVGYTRSVAPTDGEHGDSEGMITKYDGSGAEIWTSRFGGSGFDSFNSVICVTGGDIVAVGSGYSDNGDLTGALTADELNAFIVCYDSAGSVKWKHILSGSGLDTFDDVVLMGDTLVAVGKTSSSDGGLKGRTVGGLEDILLASYSLSGEPISVKTLGSSGYDGLNGVIAVDGGLLAVGSFGACDGDFATDDGAAREGVTAVLMSFDESLNRKETFIFGGSGSDTFYSVTAVKDGFVAVGAASSSDGDLAGLKADETQDCVAVGFDSELNKTWAAAFGGGGSDSFNDVITLENGDVAAVGMSSSADGRLYGVSNGGSVNAVCVCYSTDGEEKWFNIFSGHETDYFGDAVAYDDGFYVCGNSDSADGSMSDTGVRGGTDAILVRYK